MVIVVYIRCWAVGHCQRDLTHQRPSFRRHVYNHQQTLLYIGMHYTTMSKFFIANLINTVCIERICHHNLNALPPGGDCSTPYGQPMLRVNFPSTQIQQPSWLRTIRCKPIGNFYQMKGHLHWMSSGRNPSSSWHFTTRCGGRVTGKTVVDSWIWGLSLGGC